jgi:CARDB
VRANGEAGCSLGGLAYVAGNVSATALPVDINAHPAHVKTLTPFPAEPVTTQATRDAAVRVAQEAGVRPLDPVDQGLLSRLALGVCGAKPDLVQAAASGPATARPNAKFKVDDTVVNRGEAATEPFLVGIFLSPDSIVRGDDLLLAQRRLDRGLAAGAASSATTRVKITEPGTWWLGVCANWNGGVSEAAESNNCLTIGKIVVK